MLIWGISRVFAPQARHWASYGVLAGSLPRRRVTGHHMGY